MSSTEHVTAAAERATAGLVASARTTGEAGVDEAPAAWLLAAEATDYHWQARQEERWLGGYDSLDEDAAELDRIAILGRLNGRWFVAAMLVDGEGSPQDMIGCRSFAGEGDARLGFAAAR